MPDGAWDDVLRWDRVLREVYFTGQPGRPAYLDMDEDRLALVAASMGMSPGEVENQLASVVRGSLYLSSDGVFFRYTMAVRKWRAELGRVNQADPSTASFLHPPILPLLAVFVLAAERMGGRDEIAPIAYYPRLYEVLGVEDADERERLQQDFRRHSEEYWSALNEWLTVTDGANGLPTAFAVGHRYIGLPVSQALVREADRRRLPSLFERFGLAPGSDVSPERMQHLLGLWIDHSPCPVSAGLQRLWSHSRARPRIAEVAIRELDAWEVASATRRHTPPTDAGILVSALVRPFPPRVELSMLVEATAASPSVLQIDGSAGSHPADVLVLPGGWAGPLSIAPGDIECLLNGQLRAEDPEARRQMSRPPRDVVPMRFDSLLGMYIECERVPLGDDVILLVADEPPLVDSVVSQLEEVARAGFTLSRPRGLPDGWALVTGVVVLRQPPGLGLAGHPELVPAAATQLTFSGGLRLPGRTRQWSRLLPPTIRAAAEGAESIDVSLRPARSERADAARTRRWSASGASLEVDLSAESLPDGDYTVDLMADHASHHAATLRLRSADTPDLLSWEDANRLVHVADGLRPVLSAEPWDELAGPLVEGARTYAPPSPLPEAANHLVLTWGVERPDAAGSGRVREVDPQRMICLITGEHADQCSRCETDEPSTGREAVWDSLLHLGGGGIASVETVAQHVEPSRLGVVELVRSLESLAMIEVQRSPSLQPVAWSVAPACLAETVDGGWAALGGWRPHALRDLADMVPRLGGRVEQRPAGGLALTFVSGVTRTDLQGWADSAGLEVTIIPEAARSMAGALPTLGQVERGLLRIPAPGFRRAERFEPSKAKWVGTDHISAPGAYRLTSGFLTRHVYRGPRDLEQDTVAIVDAYLAKHLSARDEGRLLLAYAEPSRRLLTPLGSRLPGLYDRAAVLSAATLPEGAPRHALSAYREVPADLADRLARLLSC